MDLIICNEPQGSEEWHKARAGIPTASKMDVGFSKKRGTQDLSPAKSFTDGMNTYAAQLAADKASGLPLDFIETFKGNKATERGHELEPVARTIYAFQNDKHEIKEVSFIAKGDLIGASADFMIDDNGTAEIKAPLGKKFVQTVELMKQDIIPADYAIQCYTHLAVTGREWCDLVLYHPDLCAGEIVVQRINRDEAMIRDILKAASLISERRDEMVELLKAA